MVAPMPRHIGWWWQQRRWPNAAEMASLGFSPEEQFDLVLLGTARTDAEARAALSFYFPGLEP